MKLLLKISYVGSAYEGFQCQKSGRAVQNVLTEAAESVFGFPCHVTGCSRTDAGVHALGFCCTVEPARSMGEGWCTIPPERVHRAFSPYLPRDIAVLAAARVDDGFHPRYSAQGKEYVYKIWDSPADDPFLQGRVCRCRHRLDDAAVANMRTAAKGFEGKHDFTSFMAAGSKITEPVRTVIKTSVERDEEGILCFSVSADGFLYKMVRIMAGTLLDVAAGKIKAESIPDIIAGKNRAAAGKTAPPEGLYLREVFYGGEIDWKSR